MNARLVPLISKIYLFTLMILKTSYKNYNIFTQSSQLNFINKSVKICIKVLLNMTKNVAIMYAIILFLYENSGMINGNFQRCPPLQSNKIML